MSIENSPLVSVIIPNYNYAHLIVETLQSVQQQTYKNFECIVVDDGSTDNSVEVISQFAANDERFKLLSKRNGGLSSTRNEGMKIAQGTILAFLDSDDLWEVDKLKNQLNQLVKNNGDVVFSAIQNFRDDKNLDSVSFIEEPLDVYTFLAHNPIMGGSSNFIMKREVFEQVGFYSQDLRSAEDLHYFFRIALAGFKFAYCDTVDVKIRKHDVSMMTNHLKMFYGKLYCFELCLKLFYENVTAIDTFRLKKSFYRKFQNMLWTARGGERKDLIKITYVRFRELIGPGFCFSRVYWKNKKYDRILFYNWWKKKD